MIKCFPIDFIRQALEQTMLKEHITNENFYGGKNQVSILSFYEQLKSQEQVDRFVETYRDLTDQQNRTGLIMNGVLVAPENPTITNIYSSLIIPMSFTCSFRTTLGDRDSCIITINNLIEQLKGRKVDIAQLNGVDCNGKPCSVPFVVGTIGQNDGAPILKNGDYLGTIEDTQDIQTIIDNLVANNVVVTQTLGSWFYATNGEGKLKVMVLTEDGLVFKEDDGTYEDIIFPPEHTSFEKYKLSLSFDAIRCDEPRTLNSQEYCELSFGGSATLVSKGVRLGNDLLKIRIAKSKVDGENPIIFDTQYTYLEPLEQPSGNNIDSQVNQLLSKRFLPNAHADATTPSVQYAFILDMDIDLLKVWHDYARYGKWSLSGNDQNTKVSPNLEYTISEIYCSWGYYETKTFVGKIVENVDIENTESDVMTIGVSMQVVGN